LWLETLPVAQSQREFSGSTNTDDTFVYLHADQLETPRLATDGSGTVVWRWDSDAFGIGAADEDPDSDTNLVTVSLRFPGQYFDAETGLHCNYFRDYDPATGRYVESDPIGLEGGLNSYLYAEANALVYGDPYGLWSIRDLLPADAPLLDIADTLAGAVAYAEGRITGNEALCTVVAEDFASNRQQRVDAFLILAGGRATANRGNARAKGLPDSYLGPSGLPKRHTVEHSSRKSAREAAQRDAPRGGRVRNDANPVDRRQGPHYQAEDAAGRNARPVVHHNYPR
jgi:RHS repeat-associated protein